MRKSSAAQPPCCSGQHSDDQQDAHVEAQGGQSTDPVLVPTLRFDVSILLIIAVLAGAAWRLRR